MHGRLKHEDGFSLVELLVASTMLVVIMLATFSMLEASTGQAGRETERASAIGEAQTGLDRMVRELRHARSIYSTGPHALDVQVTRGTSTRRVVVNCDAAHPTDGALRRCITTRDGGAADVLIDRVVPPAGSTPTFTYTPATGTPRHVMVTVRARLDGGRAGGATTPLVLTDGFRLRNVP